MPGSAETIVVTDSDWMLLEDTRRVLETELPAYGVHPVKTEAEFREKIPFWSTRPPALFIIESRLSWTEPALIMPEPPEGLIEDGPDRAGIRCIQELGKVAALNTVPVIIYSVDGFSQPFDEVHQYFAGEIKPILLQKGVDCREIARATQRALMGVVASR